MSTRSRLVGIMAFAGALLMVLAPSPALARLRSPQVQVNGTGLQSILESQGESITVAHNQRDAELLNGQVASASALILQVELLRSDGSSVGLYAGHAVVPTLVQLFPPEATDGWFAVASFRSNPTRVIVGVFDANAASKGNTTTLGGDKNGIGWSVSGSGGTFYSQDAPNPGGSPQWLYLAGTGINSGSWWLAAEDRPLQGGADADFDDVVCFVETLSSGPFVTQLQRTTWGQLKTRFR